MQMRNQNFDFLEKPVCFIISQILNGILSNIEPFLNTEAVVMQAFIDRNKSNTKYFSLR
jgi:hypothetical protein